MLKLDTWNIPFPGGGVINRMFFVCSGQ